MGDTRQTLQKTPSFHQLEPSESEVKEVLQKSKADDRRLHSILRSKATTDNDNDEEYITHVHLKAIEDGKFLYDPKLIEAAVDIGTRLANLDHYVTQGGAKCIKGRYLNQRMSEIMLNDLEDFMHIVSKLTERIEFLQEYHEESHCEIASRYKNRDKTYKPIVGFWAYLCESISSGFHSAVWFVGMGFVPRKFVKHFEKKYGLPMPRVITLPHEFEKRQRQDLYGAILDALLEVANMVSDMLFVFTELIVLVKTSWAYLFWISIGAFALTFFGRLCIGVSMRKHVDWKDPKRVRKYFFGLVVAIIEPNSGFNDFVRLSFKDQESLGQSIIGESVGSFIKDPIATQAKADYMAARMSILTAVVMLVQDIPQIIVEFLYITSYEHSTFGVVYWVALITSLLAATRQIAESYNLLQDIPMLRNLVLARHLVLNPNADDTFRIANDTYEDKDHGRPRRATRTGEPNNDEDSPETASFPPNNAGRERGGPGPGRRRSSGGKYFQNRARRSDQSVKSALLKFFDWDPFNAPETTCCLFVTSWLLKLVMAPITLGLSLTWSSASMYSWTAFKHFRDTLNGTLVMEGEPFPIVKIDAKVSSKPESSHNQRGFNPLKRFLSRDTGVKRVQNGINFDEGILSFTFSRMDHIGLFKCIRTLELTDCISVDDQVLQLVARKCPSLQNLNLSFCSNVTDNGLKALRDEGCIALASITLDNCMKITDDGIEHIAKNSHRHLSRLSLRNLPELTELSLNHIGDNCPRLRELALDVDLIYKDVFIQEERDGFCSMKGSTFAHLMTRCGSSLRSLHLDNINFKFKDSDFQEFIDSLSRFVRVLSLGGMESLSDSRLDALTMRTPFLRELRIADIPKIKNVSYFTENCPSLNIIGMNGTQVPWNTSTELWTMLPDLEVLQLDHPNEKFWFWTHRVLPEKIRIYLGHNANRLKKYDKLRQRLSKKSMFTASCFGRSTSNAETRITIADDGNTTADASEVVHPAIRMHEEQNSICSQIEAINKILPRFKELYAGKLQYNNVPDMAILALVSDILDYVRRADYRLSFNSSDYKVWSSLVCEGELEHGTTLQSRLRAAVVSRSGEGEADSISSSVPWPYISLSSFGVMSTRRLNIKIDFSKNEYEFICPDEFVDIFSLSLDNKFLKGKISPLGEVNLHQVPGATRAGLQQFWFIPENARFYCWAYPVEGLDSSLLNFLEHQRYGDTVRRFLHYGGYLYFDADRHFVAASALTIGSALSFNGPFKLPDQTVELLGAEKRWQEVTIQGLIPEIAEKAYFCYIFQNETILPPVFNKTKNQFGGFAYRVDSKDPTKKYDSYFYSLCNVLEVIPDDLIPKPLHH